MLAHQSDKAMQFFIFGSPVTMSPSPDIHTTGFRECSFPHTYERFDEPDFGKVLEKLNSSTCGGGSVTIPHKEDAMKSMDELSEAARKIGAVNTVSKFSDGRLHGDNTDWLGIKNQLEARLEGKTDCVCLLCGSGGTARAAAFALQQMCASRVVIYNRTASRAESLASEFGFEACPDLAAFAQQADRLDVVVNTLPGSSDFELPDAALLRRCKPVVLEAAYIPRRTAFVKQALDAGCPIVEGVEMLFEQGCAQCEIWTGSAAPRAKIAQALLQALFTEGSDHPAHVKMEPYDAVPPSLTTEADSGSRCTVS